VSREIITHGVANLPDEGSGTPAKTSLVSLVRARYGLSQVEMANKLGCSPGHVSLMERTGEAPKHTNQLMALAEMASKVGIELGEFESNRLSQIVGKQAVQAIKPKRQRRFKTTATPVPGEGVIVAEEHGHAGAGDAGTLARAIAFGTTDERITAAIELAESSATVRIAAAGILRQIAESNGTS
jgi:transcriptional regulator with XRE-family HTH domain